MGMLRNWCNDGLAAGRKAGQVRWKSHGEEQTWAH